MGAQGLLPGTRVWGAVSVGAAVVRTTNGSLPLLHPCGQLLSLVRSALSISLFYGFILDMNDGALSSDITSNSCRQNLLLLSSAGN